MTDPFEQYLQARRERAIRDGDARPMPRAFASNARYIVGEGRTRDELQVTGAWLATDRPEENRA